MHRIALPLAATTAVVAAALVVVVSVARSRSAPTLAPPTTAAETQAEIPGLAAPVTIATDRWGIPHLTASNRADLYRAWGYVTARDRLWQLESTRRAAEGRAWEWFGNRSLRDDGGAELFQLRERAARDWNEERSDARARVPLEAFAGGVNAFLAQCRRGERPWPEELRRLHGEPGDWRPQDSYLIVYAQAMVLDFALPEIAEADEIARRGRAAAEARRRFEDRVEYVTVQDSATRGDKSSSRRVGGEEASSPTASNRPGAAATLESLTRSALVEPLARSATLEPLARSALGHWLAGIDPEARASNAFAVGPARSRSGKPLLANDPHLPLAVPSSLYAIHLTVPDTVDAAGVCTPGVPSLISGRNRSCAWGVTSLGADVFDVYADSLSADGHRVWTGRDWAPVRERPFRMRYRLPGGLEVPVFGQVRRYTPHGPVVVWQPKRHRALSVRWTADYVRLTLAHVLGLESSRGAAEIVSRMTTLRLPVFNVIAADLGGDVVYQTTGAVPARDRDPGLGPLPGDGAHEWRGVVPAQAMPRWRPPRDGFVVNSNNRPVRGNRPAPWPRYDFPHDRALRIAERLSGDTRLTLDDLRSVQNDVVSRGARRIVPRLLAAVAPVRPSLIPRARAALDTLSAWDGEARRGRVAPTLFRAWYGAFLRRSRLEGVPGLALAALDGEARDELTTPGGTGRETPTVAAAAALDTALSRLATMLGPDLSTWTWGRAHQASFAHRLSWREPDLALDRVPEDGDNSTVCVGRSNLPWSTAVTHGPAWRMLVDLADGTRAWVVLPPGNSGEASSGHARDLLASWVNHRYVPLLLDPRDVARVTEHRTRLIPQQSPAR